MLKEELNQPPQPPVEGDGKAIFLDFGTEEEYEDMVLKEDKGWGGFLNKVFNLNKNNDEANSNEVDSEGEAGDSEASSGTGEGGSEEGR